MKRDLVLSLYRNDFRSFLRFAFCEVYPSKELADGWYLDIVADELMRCLPDVAHRLMLNLPPRYLKSFCASIAWPIFMAARYPGLRICVIAGTRELAAEFSELRKRLLASPRLQVLFPQLKAKDVAETLTFTNKAQIVQSHVAKSQIGRGADIFVIDDPLPARHARSPKHRNAINAWYRDEIIARLSRKDQASLIVVMQRLHEDDLCGNILRSEKNWRRATLSAIAPGHEKWELRDGRVIERSMGEVLCDQIESLASLHAVLTQMQGANFRAQYLQQPLPSESDNELRIFWHRRRVPHNWRIGMPELEPRGGFKRVPEHKFVEFEFFGVVNPFKQGREKTQEEIREHCVISQRALMQLHRHKKSIPNEPEPITSWRDSPHWRRKS